MGRKKLIKEYKCEHCGYTTNKKSNNQISGNLIILSSESCKFHLPTSK